MISAHQPPARTVIADKDQFLTWFLDFDQSQTRGEAEKGINGENGKTKTGYMYEDKWRKCV